MKKILILLLATTLLLFSCTTDDITIEEWSKPDEETTLTLPFEENDKVYRSESYYTNCDNFQLVKFINNNKLIIAKVENNIVLPSYIYDIESATKKTTYLVSVNKNVRQNIGERQEYRYSLVNSNIKVIIVKHIYKLGKGDNKEVAIIL